MLPTDFTLTNIGKIEHATIKLNKFTVLCGKNSVGKSFFSKSLFLLYKSIYEYEEWVYIEIERKIERCFMNLFFIARLLNSPLRGEISSLRKKIALYLEEKNLDRLFYLLNKAEKTIKDIENQTRRSKQLSFFDKQTVNKELEAKLIAVNEEINSLKKLLNSLRENPYDILKKSIDYFIRLIFKGRICRYGTEISNINLGNNYLKLKENKIVSLECSEIIERKRNVLFIESPFILEIFEQMAKLTKSQIPFFKKRYEKYILPYHIEDIINQIRGYEGLPSDNTSLLEKIETIIKGKLKYSPLKEEIIFQEKKHSIHALNTASGILTFGVLYLLLQSGAFDENMILIFEEPETNLHPEWQVKIVEILKTLMEGKGVQIFLTTHSPFIVKAVEVLALEDKSFKENLSINLLYEDGKTVCDFEESTEKIYDQLLGPFSNLMFKGWFYE